MSIENYLFLKGFIIPSNEIYGGKKGLFDYGHIGVLLKKNIQSEWEKFFVLTKPNVYLIESSILTSHETLLASGHIENFNDILIDCIQCKRRFREDHLPEKKCPQCGSKSFTEPKPFNLIFKTQSDHYLRPETAQGIFINFKNILRINSTKLPLGIAQIGKSFRNEITISSSIFRTKEFEQMELEWFTNPSLSNSKFEECLAQMKTFLLEKLHFKEENIRFKEIEAEDRAHYSSRSVDVEFLYPHGWGELWGLANRTDFDLSSHSKSSSEELIYTDPISNEKYIPHVVEHSIGLNRLMYALILNSYECSGDREILKLNYSLAPYKYAILPLTKKHEEEALSLQERLLKESIPVLMLTKGSIGKRYRKCDAIGVPYCLTLDDESLNDPKNPSFTIRDRDTTEQKRITFHELQFNASGEFK